MDSVDEEQLLIGLTHWLRRVTQYGTDHPSCMKMGEQLHKNLTRALLASSPLAFGILKEDVLVGETRLPSRVLRERFAPHLHERGILLVRFVAGVGVRELEDFVSVIALPAQSIYDRGGIVRLLHERGVVHVEVEELEHDVTAEEREAHARRTRLRDFFHEMLRNLRAHRDLDAVLGEHLRVLLAHPAVAVTLLEEDPVGIAEATAGLALMAREEGDTAGIDLSPRVREIILALTPPSRARLLLGLPSLTGDFRQALLWAIQSFSESDLARLVFAAARARPESLDLVLYAFAVAVPRDGRRQTAMRHVARGLADLPDDEPSREMLAELARPIAEYESFAQDREALRAEAERVLMARAAATPPSAAAHASGRPPALWDSRASVASVVRLAARTKAFERVCRALPSSASAYAEAGSRDAILGIVRGLRDTAPDDRTGAAAAALRAIGSSNLTSILLRQLDESVTTTDSAALDELMDSAKALVVYSPAEGLKLLDSSSSRKVRRLLLDALETCGTKLLPLLTPRLKSPQWFVARNAVLLVGRCGGSAAHLVVVAQHPHEKVRMEVVRALRSIAADTTSTNIATGYLSDAVPDIRHAALMALRSETLTVPAVRAIQEIAQRDDESEETILRVITLLGGSPLDDAADALFALLAPRGLIDRGSAAFVRDMTAVALRHSRAPRAHTLFESGLRSSSGRIRRACEHALEKGPK